MKSSVSGNENEFATALDNVDEIDQNFPITIQT